MEKAIHFSEMLQLLRQAQERKMEVDLTAWKLGKPTDMDKATKVRYQNWLVRNNHWRGGHVLLQNPRNGEMRRVPEVFITRIMGKKVYL